MNRLHISTYAVDDCSVIRQTLDPKAEDLGSTRYAYAFVKYMFESVKKKYPTINTAVPYDRKNKNASTYNFRNDFLSKSDVVYFSGHGNQQFLAFYDGILKSSQRPLGGDIRWAIFDACLYLNVNKEKFLDKPLTTETIDFSKVDELRKVFNGVHAVLGNYAKGRQYYNTTGDSEDDLELIKNNHKDASILLGAAGMYEFFAKYFIEEGRTIWDAYRLTVENMYKKFFSNSGFKPAIAFLRGYDKNGEYHDTSVETFEHVYKAPLKPEAGLELFVMYETYGKPKF
ncbi:MAG: hypothetical protein MJ250_09240 [Alphaproteobacteria bacterium]|nr:hypothetical protein [Alphaproteobacteria bacterium]